MVAAAASFFPQNLSIYQRGPCPDIANASSIIIGTARFKPFAVINNSKYKPPVVFNFNRHLNRIGVGVTSDVCQHLLCNSIDLELNPDREFYRFVQIISGYKIVIVDRPRQQELKCSGKADILKNGRTEVLADPPDLTRYILDLSAKVWLRYRQVVAHHQ